MNISKYNPLKYINLLHIMMALLIIMLFLSFKYPPIQKEPEDIVTITITTTIINTEPITESGITVGCDHSKDCEIWCENKGYKFGYYAWKDLKEECYCYKDGTLIRAW